MATYTIQLADGRKAKIQAPDEKSALAAARAIPPLKGERAAYQQELVKQRKQDATRRDMDERSLIGGGRGSAITGSAPIPIMDEIRGGLNAGGDLLLQLRRAGAPGGGRIDLGRTRAIYEAGRDAELEYEAETRRRYPVSSFAGSLLTGLGKNQVAKVPGLLAQVPSKAKALGQAVGVGAGTGAAYGAAEGRTLEERGRNAVTGALVGGGTAGLLEGVVAPAGGAAVRTGKRVVADVKRAVRKPDAAKEGAKGTRAALEILARKNLTADAVEAAAPEMRTRGMMAAELAGPDVERQLAATARRGGQTGDDVTRLVRERQEAAPDRILTDLEESLGINPERVGADIEGQIQLGRDLAKPEWEAIDANPAGIWNDELAELAQRPAVRRVLAAQAESGRNAGRTGTGLAMGSVDVPSRPVDLGDLGLPPTEMKVPRGPAEPPGRGPSALTFLRMTGHGIDEAMAGEAAQAGLRLGARKGGANLDDMAERLWSAGYTPRKLSEREMAELLDSGGAARLYSREAEAGAQSRFEARQAAEDFNARGGDPNDPAIPRPEDYEADLGMPESRPLTEPALTEAPTGSEWLRVKRALDQLVERDPVTKRTISSGEVGLRNRDLATVSGDLRRALAGDDTRAGAVPGAREALAKSGEALGIEDAFVRTQGRLVKGSTREFGKLWGSLKSDAEKDAARGALVSDLYELWATNGLKVGRIKNPRVMGKLELAFGKAGADELIKRLGQEAKLAASGSRIAPAGGSPTFGLAEAGREADDAIPVGDLGRILGKVGKLDVLGAGGDILQTLAKRGEAYGRTAGMSEEARDAYGRVLMMGPDELIPLLREFERLPPPVQAAVRERATVLGLIGGQVASAGVGGDRPDR